jgi:hypothetical protein
MFPLIAIAGAISAVASVAKGASWLSAHVGAAKTASADGNAHGKPQTSAKASPFEAVLAAQAAGQTLPVSARHQPTARCTAPTDALARMKAGLVAYNHVGEHHGKHRRRRGR